MNYPAFYPINMVSTMIIKSFNLKYQLKGCNSDKIYWILPFSFDFHREV